MYIVQPECVILCPAFCSIMRFQLYSELHISMHCQLVDFVISKPELSVGVTKTEFVVSPVPIKILPWISKVTTPLDNLQYNNINQKVVLLVLSFVPEFHFEFGFARLVLQYLLYVEK